MEEVPVFWSRSWTVGFHMHGVQHGAFRRDSVKDFASRPCWHRRALRAIVWKMWLSFPKGKVAVENSLHTCSILDFCDSPSVHSDVAFWSSWPSVQPKFHHLAVPKRRRLRGTCALMRRSRRFPKSRLSVGGFRCLLLLSRCQFDDYSSREQLTSEADHQQQSPREDYQEPWGDRNCREIDSSSFHLGTCPGLH